MNARDREIIRSAADEGRELTESERSQLSIVGQRELRQREKDRARKAKQRERKAQGITAGAANRLRESWAKNLAIAKADPELCKSLQERLLDFVTTREQMRAALTRMTHDVHPEALPDDGRFPEMIACDVLDLAKKYGVGPFWSPDMIVEIDIESQPAPHQQAVVDRFKAQEAFHYRMTYGLNIDRLGDLEIVDFFSQYFDWFLRHRNDPNLDYSWGIADEIARDFKIDERYLTGILADPRGIWSRLDRYRKGLTEVASNPTPVNPEQLSRIRTEAEIRRDCAEGQDSFRKSVLPSFEF